MITDEKRREVARKLLALDMSDIEVDGCIIDSPKYVGLLLMRILDAACDYRDGLRYFPGFFSAQAVVELLAELINRPAVRPEPCSPAYWRCPRCGAFNYKAAVTDCCGVIPPHYCANCGAEVVEGD